MYVHQRCAMCMALTHFPQAYSPTYPPSPKPHLSPQPDTPPLSPLFLPPPLQVLDISHNHIEVVPEAIAHMSALSHLDLSRNWLNGASLGRLSGLTQLKVEGGERG